MYSLQRTAASSELPIATDFNLGTTFVQRRCYFEEYLRPRSPCGLPDLVTMDLLPPLLGLYRPDMLLRHGCPNERMRRKPGWREIGQVDGVLPSHAQVDHSGYISFVRDDIPVDCSTMTAVMAKAMQNASVTDFEKEVYYQTPRGEDEEGVIGTSSWRNNP